MKKLVIPTTILIATIYDTGSIHHNDVYLLK